MLLKFFWALFFFAFRPLPFPVIWGETLAVSSCSSSAAACSSSGLSPKVKSPQSKASWPRRFPLSLRRARLDILHYSRRTYTSVFAIKNCFQWSWQTQQTNPMRVDSIGFRFFFIVAFQHFRVWYCRHRTDETLHQSLLFNLQEHIFLQVQPHSSKVCPISFYLFFSGNKNWISVQI